MRIDPTIIKRYLDGSGEKGDQEKIMYWFSNLPDESELRDIYNRYWKELPEDTCEEGYDERKMLGEIYHRIRIEESLLSNEKEKSRTLRKVITIFTRIAALLFIPLTVFVFLNRDRLTPAKSDVAYSEIYAPLGTRTKFYLPDGSSGYLNAGSTIQFPTAFTGKSRKVNLKGEAYFDVRSNPDKPFIVSGENIRAIAYGTAFNVEAYPGDPVNKVTLVHGKVEVLGRNKNELQSLGILKPDEMWIFNGEGASSKFVQVNAKNVVSWKDGKLIFRNDPFSEVIKKLNRKYSVNIIIKDNRLNDYSYMATFEDETLDEVLKLLKLSAPIKMKELKREKNPDGSFGERSIELYYTN